MENRTSKYLSRRACQSIVHEYLSRVFHYAILHPVLSKPSWILFLHCTVLIITSIGPSPRRFILWPARSASPVHLAPVISAYSASLTPKAALGMPIRRRIGSFVAAMNPMHGTTQSIDRTPSTLHLGAKLAKRDFSSNNSPMESWGWPPTTLL